MRIALLVVGILGIVLTVWQIYELRRHVAQHRATAVQGTGAPKVPSSLLDPFSLFDRWRGAASSNPQLLASLMSPTVPSSYGDAPVSSSLLAAT